MNFDNIPVAYTIDELSLKPRFSRIASRYSSDIQLTPFLYSAPMDTVSSYELTKALLKHNHCSVISRFVTYTERMEMIRDFGFNESKVFIAIPLYTPSNFDAWIKELAELHGNEAFTINVAVDIAHGLLANAIKLYQHLDNHPNVKFIMSGSICSSTDIDELLYSGLTHLRVGVGPSHVCTTRRMAGVGVPNASAVAEIREALPKHDYNRPGWWDIKAKRYRDIPLVIADGGISEPGQAFKYLALGADAVMLGYVFAKAHEARGWDKTTCKKSYRGQASKEFQEEVLNKTYHCPEGIALPDMEWDGTTVASIVNYFEGGVRSGLSYMGLSSSEQVYDSISEKDFVKLNTAGIREGTAHGLL